MYRPFKCSICDRYFKSANWGHFADTYQRWSGKNQPDSDLSDWISSSLVLRYLLVSLNRNNMLKHIVKYFVCQYQHGFSRVNDMSTLLHVNDSPIGTCCSECLHENFYLFLPHQLWAVIWCDCRRHQHQSDSAEREKIWKTQTQINHLTKWSQKIRDLFLFK